MEPWRAILNQQSTLQGLGSLSIVIKLFSGYSGFTLCPWVKSLYECLYRRSLDPGTHAVYCFKTVRLPVKRWSWVCRQAFRFSPCCIVSEGR